MLLSEFISRCTADLAAVYPQPEARSIVTLLLTGRLGLPSWKLVTEPGLEVSGEELSTLEKDIRRLLRNEPIQYVLGYTEFYGRRFVVSPSVLIPRPETELLVERAIATMPRPNGRILDLCTGSGCIAWSLAYAFPQAEVVAVDVSEEALQIAREQFSDDPSRPSVRFVRADILNPSFIESLGQFDLVVSNPPYIAESERSQMRRNVLDYEPELALFVPDEDPLLFYRAVAAASAATLSPDGCGIVEINEHLGPQTMECFAVFSEVELIKDLSSRDRFVSFRR